MNLNDGHPISILLVEDNSAHAQLMMRSFEDHQIANEIHHVTDGEAALHYLFQQGEYHNVPEPDIVLLDLRLPKIDGIEVLKTIKESSKLSHIPVVMLTTSNADRDVTAAYSNHVNSYLVKPIEFDKFKQLMKDLGFYWLAWNKKPRRDI